MFIYIHLQKPNFPVTLYETIGFFKAFNIPNNSFTNISVFVCKCVTGWKMVKYYVVKFKTW